MEKSKEQSLETESQQSAGSVENEQETNKESASELGPLDRMTPEQLKEWGRRQAADAARYRKKLAATKAAMEEARRKEQEAQGKYKEMYEAEREQRLRIQRGLEEGIKISQLKNALLGLGCNPKFIDKAIRLVDLSGIEADPETLKADEEQIMYEAKRVKEELPVLFTKDFKGVNDGVPGTVNATKKSIRELSDEELDRAYRSVLKEGF